MTSTRTEGTYTSDDGIVHDVRRGGGYTRCDELVPSDWNRAMPGWPAPPKLDRHVKLVTCITCIAMEDS